MLDSCTELLDSCNINYRYSFIIHALYPEKFWSTDLSFLAHNSRSSKTAVLLERELLLKKKQKMLCGRVALPLLSPLCVPCPGPQS